MVAPSLSLLPKHLHLRLWAAAVVVSEADEEAALVVAEEEDLEVVVEEADLEDLLEEALVDRLEVVVLALEAEEEVLAEVTEEVVVEEASIRKISLASKAQAGDHALPAEEAVQAHRLHPLKAASVEAVVADISHAVHLPQVQVAATPLDMAATSKFQEAQTREVLRAAAVDTTVETVEEEVEVVVTEVIEEATATEMPSDRATKQTHLYPRQGTLSARLYTARRIWRHVHSIFSANRLSVSYCKAMTNRKMAFANLGRAQSGVGNQR